MSGGQGEEEGQEGAHRHRAKKKARPLTADATSSGRDLRGPSPKVLLFHGAEDYYHESIPAVLACLLRIARRNGWRSVATDDPSVFEGAGALDDFGAIVFVSNSGDMLPKEAQREALKNYVLTDGGGVLGIHGAIASFLDIVDSTGSTAARGTWDFFGNMIGAYFTSHPPVQSALLRSDTDKAAAVGLWKLPKEWNQTDEWYNYDRNPSLDPDVTVVAEVDESSYEGQKMRGENGHPVIWHKKFGEAPIFYTALGHLSEHYEVGGLGEHILEAGLRFAGGLPPLPKPGS